MLMRIPAILSLLIVLVGCDITVNRSTVSRFRTNPDLFRELTNKRPQYNATAEELRGWSRISVVVREEYCHDRDSAVPCIADTGRRWISCNGMYPVHLYDTAAETVELHIRQTENGRLTVCKTKARFLRLVRDRD